MFRINLSVEGEVVIDRVLQGIEDRTRDLTPVWPTVVTIFRGIVAKAFATEGGSTGAPWAPLAPRTQADRKRQGFPPAHPILQRTGKLMRALTIGEGAAVVTTPVSLRYVVSNQETPYFKYHQSRAPRTRLPRRAPVLLTADDRTAIVHPIRLWITGRDPNAQRRSRVG
jgi:hypothetical protein